MASVKPEDTVKYVVETQQDYIGFEAHQMSHDDNGNLLILKFKEKEGYQIPQLTMIAMFPKGHWMSVREVTDEQFAELTA